MPSAKTGIAIAEASGRHEVEMEDWRGVKGTKNFFFEFVTRSAAGETTRDETGTKIEYSDVKVRPHLAYGAVR
jgi:hypothetical protein